MFVKSAPVHYSSFLRAFYSSSFYHFLVFVSALIPNIFNISSVLTFVGVVLLIVLGMFKKKEKLKENFSPKSINAVIIVHNEEDAVAAVVDSCLKAHFDDVYLILDACTDNTLNVAKTRPVKIIQVNERSKSKALNVALPLIIKRASTEAFYVFFDAGNYIEENFLKKALPFIKSYPIIQFRTRNANHRSIVSRMFLIMNAFYFKIQNALNMLNFSAMLCGFGWGAYGWVLNEYPYRCKSLVDDFEYTLKVGYNVKYIDAVDIHDEKPDSFYISCQERLRWMRGYFYESTYFCPHLYFYR